MKKMSLILLSALIISACAALESKPPPTIHPARVTPAAPLKKKMLDEVPNPFESKAEEELFWKALSGELTDEDVAKIKDAPKFKMAMAMRLLLSCLFTDNELRGAMINALTGNLARLQMNDETIAKVTEDLSGEEMKNRWGAMHFIFEMQSKGTAIIYYVLNDEEHLLEFFKKETAKCEMMKKTAPDGKPFKPAPPATSAPPDKSQSSKKHNKNLAPSPRDGKMEHNQ